MKLLKKQIPSTIEEYCKIRIEADKNGYVWSNDVSFDNGLSYMIFEEKKKKTKTEKPKIETTILYQDNRELWKAWRDSTKEKYKEFRNARYESHKDYVSPLSEKKLLNIINKYPERVSIALMEYSLGYKKIVEDHKVIDMEMKIIQQENAKVTEELQKKEAEKHKEEVMTARQQRDEKIKATGIPYEYWRWRVLCLCILEGKRLVYCEPLIPTTINKLLDTV